MKMENKKEINIAKYRLAGDLPKFIPLSHRHLEKEKPKGEINAGEERFTIPTDLLSLTGISADLVGEIESIQLVYGRKGAAPE